MLRWWKNVKLRRLMKEHVLQVQRFRNFAMMFWRKIRVKQARQSVALISVQYII
jgi:hypothetical protein